MSLNPRRNAGENKTGISTDMLVRVLATNGITTAKIVKSKPGWGRPGIKAAHNAEELQMSKPDLKPVTKSRRSIPLIDAISTPAAPDPFDLEKLAARSKFRRERRRQKASYESAGAETRPAGFYPRPSR